MPTYNADRDKGETFRQFRKSFDIWHALTQVNDFAPIEKQKYGLASTMKGNATRVIKLHGPGTPTFAGCLTVKAYLNLLHGVFVPAAESSMAHQDF